MDHEDDYMCYDDSNVEEFNLLEANPRLNILSCFYDAGLKSVYYARRNASVSYQTGSSMYCLPQLTVPTRNLFLNCTTQGTANGERIGSKISMHHLFVKGSFQLTGSATPVTLRFIIYVRTDNANRTPESVVDLFPNVTSYSTLLYNSSALGRHPVILFDKTYVPKTQSLSGTSYTNDTQEFDIHIDLHDLRCTYSANTGESTDIVDNGIGVIAFANRVNGGFVTNQATISYESKVFYSDL